MCHHRDYHQHLHTIVLAQSVCNASQLMRDANTSQPNIQQHAWNPCSWWRVSRLCVISERGFLGLPQRWSTPVSRCLQDDTVVQLATKRTIEYDVWSPDKLNDAEMDVLESVPVRHFCHGLNVLMCSIEKVFLPQGNPCVSTATRPDDTLTDVSNFGRSESQRV